MKGTERGSSLGSLKRLRADYRETLRIGRSLLLELSTWHSSLPAFPPSIQHAGNTQDYSIDNSASLELGYHTLQLIVFRALLRAFGVGFSTVQERETSEWKEANDQCRAAARTAVIASHHFASSLSTIHFQACWAPCKLIYSRYETVDLLCTKSLNNVFQSCF
jgi:hypothetical protein